MVYISYKFYYDETGHDRKLTTGSLLAKDSSDIFLSCILGWDNKLEENIFNAFNKLLKKYGTSESELKSNYIKNKDLNYGFASLSKHKIGFVKDFLGLLDSYNIIISLNYQSKLECLVKQLVEDIEDSNVSKYGTIYTLTKLLTLYSPTNVYMDLLDNTKLVNTLNKFLQNQYQKDLGNMILKRSELQALLDCKTITKDLKEIKTIKFDYESHFKAFKKVLYSYKVYDYTIVLDNEGILGIDSDTCKAAKNVGLNNVFEVDSKDSLGIQITDIFIGILGKLLKNLSSNFSKDYSNKCLQPVRLDTKWFDLREDKIHLYTILYKILHKDKTTFRYGIYIDTYIYILNYLYLVTDDSFNRYNNNSLILSEINVTSLHEYFSLLRYDELQEFYSIIIGECDFDE